MWLTKRRISSRPGVKSLIRRKTDTAFPLCFYYAVFQLSFLLPDSIQWGLGERGTNEYAETGVWKESDRYQAGKSCSYAYSAIFMVGLNAPASENHGKVLMGTLGWIGNFRFTFEVDNVGNLRVIPAINPYASNYELEKGEVFTTPEFIFTLSEKGTGEGSRNFQRWACNYQLKDGKGSRLSLLNNWENTAFDFNEDMLVDLIGESKELGVDMFLLDDGWFGNKYKRSADTAGLGDWEVTADKLPGGLNALIQAAKKEGVKFGLWIEPEW